MNKFLKLASAIAILTSPIAAFSQDIKPLTRAQVYADMVQYEKAGFNPARQNPQTWVDDAHRARAVVAAEQATEFAHVANDHTASGACDSRM
jgi:hypothetical protein